MYLFPESMQRRACFFGNALVFCADRTSEKGKHRQVAEGKTDPFVRKHAPVVHAVRREKKHRAENECRKKVARNPDPLFPKHDAKKIQPFVQEKARRARQQEKQRHARLGKRIEDH